MGYDLSTNEVTTFWKLFSKLRSFYYFWDLLSAKSLYSISPEGMACKRNIKHEESCVFPWRLYNVKHRIDSVNYCRCASYRRLLKCYFTVPVFPKKKWGKKFPIKYKNLIHFVELFNSKTTQRLLHSSYVSEETKKPKLVFTEIWLIWLYTNPNRIPSLWHSS